jgi:hypothetical protein
MKNEILTPEEMMELATTKEGREFVKQYIIRSRVAFSMQLVFEILGVIPEEDRQHACCDAVYDALQRVDIAVVMTWLQEAVENVDCVGMEC